MIILGSSGSIGKNALAIAKNYHLEVETLAVGKNISTLNAQIAQFQPKSVIIAQEQDATSITQSFTGKIYIGKKGMLQAIKDSKSNLVINALVGFIGLEPTLCAIACGKMVALANKESLVVGGGIIDMQHIIPIDSEHFSLKFLLDSHTLPFRNLYITASGGAFRDIPLSAIPHQNATNALKHPNWQMGKKITIDSATMANKLFEVLEAYWLFQSKNITALIERNSHIHALVEFYDGSVIAHFATANMQLPIVHAISSALDLDLSQCIKQTPIIPPLNFKNTTYQLQEIDTNRYPLWNLKDQLLENPKLGLILNAANEIAIDAFLQDLIPFGAISNLSQQALQAFKNEDFHSLESIIALDSEVRAYTKKAIQRIDSFH